MPEAQGSWALPLLHERIPSTNDPLTAMAQQLAQVCRRSPERGLGLFDAEYGNARFVRLTARLPCDKIVRLRSNLCLYTAPGPYRGRGRPPVHGRKFKFRDARTWGTPSETLHGKAPDLGPVTGQRWDLLHLKKAARHSLTLIRIECHDPPAGAPRSPGGLVGLARRARAPAGRVVAALLPSLRGRSLVSLRQAVLALDPAALPDPGTNRMLEWPDAVHDLGALAGPTAGARKKT